MAKKPTEEAAANSAEPTKAVTPKKTTAKKTTKKEEVTETVETQEAPVADSTVDVAVVEEKAPEVDQKAAHAEFLDNFN